MARTAVASPPRPGQARCLHLPNTDSTAPSSSHGVYLGCIPKEGDVRPQVLNANRERFSALQGYSGFKIPLRTGGWPPVDIHSYHAESSVLLRTSGYCGSIPEAHLSCCALPRGTRGSLGFPPTLSIASEPRCQNLSGL